MQYMSSVRGKYYLVKTHKMLLDLRRQELCIQITVPQRAFNKVSSFKETLPTEISWELSGNITVSYFAAPAVHSGADSSRSASFFQCTDITSQLL